MTRIHINEPLKTYWLDWLIPIDYSVRSKQIKLRFRLSNQWTYPVPERFPHNKLKYVVKQLGQGFRGGVVRWILIDKAIQNGL